MLPFHARNVSTFNSIPRGHEGLRLYTFDRVPSSIWPLLPFNGKVICTSDTGKYEGLHSRYSQFMYVMYVPYALSPVDMKD